MSVISNMKLPLVFQKAAIFLPEIPPVDVKLEVEDYETKVYEDGNNNAKREDGSICTTCGKIFDSPSKLKRHLSLSHFRRQIQDQYPESFARLQVVYLLYSSNC